MTDEQHKQAYRLFWLTKGHFNTTEETILASAKGYFNRLWTNNERVVYAEEGFEEAYENRHT